MLNICYESTKECNLNCDYCITADNPRLKGNDNYIDIINYIVKLKPERIVISGGEPLIDHFLVNKLKMIFEKLPNTYVSLSTNGVEENFDFEKIIDYVDCFDFSIPTMDNEVYKIMRGQDCIDNVKKNIESIIKLKKNQKSKFDLKISYVLTKMNKDSLVDVLNYAREIKVDSFRIGRFFPFRNAIKYESKYSLDEDEIKEELSKINFNEYPFKITKPISNIELMENGYVTINFSGDIFYPTRKGKNIIGNIYNTPIENLFKINSKQQLIFKNLSTKKIDYVYEKYLVAERIRKSNVPRSLQDEFNSDRTRIIYSSSFRRLQQKAQVFSLEKNSNVRSRLTHSIEVSDVGRILATRIAEKLTSINGSYKLKSDDSAKIISIVETACLMHDLGNPPFGHFGEDAIKKWWKDKNDIYIKEYNQNAKLISANAIDMNNSSAKMLLKDFEFFDGNPQGFRIATRLYSFNDRKGQKIESGLNLTFSTLMCALKYVGCSDNLNPKDVDKSISKKPGYFVSEKRIVEYISQKMKLELGYRFPFTYIMEAADDIAYCLSDIADGIEKQVLTIPQFAKEFQQIWKDKFDSPVPEEILSDELMNDMLENRIKDFNTKISSLWATYISNEVVNVFVNNIQNYIEGSVSEIITERNMKEQYRLLNTLKTISNKIIYRSPEAEAIEVAGFSIVSGLLDFFGVLLRLPMEHFYSFVCSDQEIKESDELGVYNDKIAGEVKKNYAYEFRIYNMLSKRCVKSYMHQIQEWNKDNNNSISIENIEWWLRVHLIIDHISGMTDDYALQSYQLAKGIDIKIK